MGQIEGRVALANSEEGVPSAEVSLFSAKGGERRSVSGPDGRFTLREVPAGAYAIRVERPGFFVATDSGNPTSLSLGPGENLRGVILRVRRSGVLAGRLTDGHGNPRSRIGVAAMRREYFNGSVRMQIVGGTTTDDHGDYRLSNLRPGDYLISTPLASNREIDTVTYYPGVVDPETAVVVSLSAGAEIGGLNFAIGSAEVHKVRVRVLAPITGQLSAQSPLSVLLYSKRRTVPETLWRPRVLGNSVYEFENVPSGGYFLDIKGTATLTGAPESIRLFGSGTAIVGNDDLDMGTILAEPGFALVGRVTLRGSGLSVQIARRLRISLVESDGFERARVSPTNLNDDGTFAFFQIPSGTYRVGITDLPQNLYPELARFEGRLVTDLVISLDRTPSTALELSLAEGAGSIEGVTRDSRNGAIPGVYVVLVPPAPLSSNPNLFRTASSDARGAFEFHGLVPGNYQLLALEHADKSVHLRPGFMTQFEGRRTAVSVSPSATARVELRSIPVSQP